MNNLKLKTVRLVSLLFLLVTFSLIITGCQTPQKEVRSENLIDNLISEIDEGFVFEQISWGKRKEDLFDERHILKIELEDPDADALVLDDKASFKNPNTDATVIYQFEDDLFIGGEYVIETKDEDDLVKIAGEIKEQLSKAVGEPDSNTLDELSEESVRNGSNGIAYLDHGEGSLEILFTQNSATSLTIKTRGPREVLERFMPENE